MSLRRAVLVMISGLALAVSAMADPSPLALKMRTMAVAMKSLQHPGTPPAAANPLDDLKTLKDTATDCRDHSDELAPAEIVGNADALQAFKAEFDLLLAKIDALEAALKLPADDPNHDAAVKAALADVTAVKRDGHDKFNNH